MIMEGAMKYPIRIGKRFYIGIFFAVVGLVCLLFGIISDYKYSNALSFECLTKENCRSGRYVSGIIYSYVYQDSGKGRINGISEEMVGASGSTYTFTVHIGNGEMIRIRVNDWEKRRELENILTAEEPIWFEGKIVRASDEPNWTWYEGTGLENPEEIIAEYVVQQANINIGTEFICGGLCFMAFSVIYLALYCRLCRNGLMYR